MSQLPPPDVTEKPIRDHDELEQPFRSSEKPVAQFRIGAEAEKFGMHSATLAPLPYSGPCSVVTLFAALTERYGWKPVAEAPGSPVIALERGGASLTLEPGAQLELSGSPLSNLHEIEAEISSHFDELGALSEEFGIKWLSLGFQPLAQPDELPWVPKERYGIMKRYLPTRGRRGRDMMQRTATVQANFDYESEPDAMRKLQVSLRLAAVFQAMSANSPFREGSVSELRSERVDVWLNMDPSRSGLVPSLWELEQPLYRHYVEWALDAGMFFFKRGSRLHANTGQTFRNFLRDGFEGQRATPSDWTRHLATLFPEVRLKSTLEVRTSDALPEHLTLAMPALFTGLLYDPRALSEAEELARGLSFESVAASREEIARLGMSARIGDTPVRDLAERLIDVASGGLERRARLDAQGRDERRHLAPLARLAASGRSPADELVGSLRVGDPVDAAALQSSEVAGGTVQRS